MRQDVYSGRLNLDGEEYEPTLTAANNLAFSLLSLQRFEEAKSLLRKWMPVAQRLLGETDKFTFTMRWLYAAALYEDAGATLDDLREAVTTLEDTERTARRVLGGAHPLVGKVERALREARAALGSREAVAAMTPAQGSGDAQS